MGKIDQIKKYTTANGINEHIRDITDDIQSYTDIYLYIIAVVQDTVSYLNVSFEGLVIYVLNYSVYCIP